MEGQVYVNDIVPDHHCLIHKRGFVGRWAPIFIPRRLALKSNMSELYRASLQTSPK